jgi:hypothetical protein
MLRKLRRHMSFANVTSLLALFVALGGTTAYAANTVFSTDIVDGEVKTADLATVGVTNPKLATGAVTTTKIAPLAVMNSRLNNNAVTSEKIFDSQVTSNDIATGAVRSAEVLDFVLTNQDVGVLFAEVNADATIAASSGGVFVTRVGAVGAGQYEVDFGHFIATTCTAVATIGSATTTPAAGEVNVTDRVDNVEAVLVDTNGSGGGAADKPFRLVVVC